MRKPQTSVFMGEGIHYEVQSSIKGKDKVLVSIKLVNMSAAAVSVYGRRGLYSSKRNQRLFWESSKCFSGDTLDWPEVYYAKFHPVVPYAASNLGPIPISRLEPRKSLRERYVGYRKNPAEKFYLVQGEFDPEVFTHYYVSSITMPDALSPYDSLSKKVLIEIRNVD
jgi:hypothetical protein